MRILTGDGFASLQRPSYGRAYCCAQKSNTMHGTVFDCLARRADFHFPKHEAAQSGRTGIISNRIVKRLPPDALFQAMGTPPSRAYDRPGLLCVGVGWNRQTYAAHLLLEKGMGAARRCPV
jgi:hypothetical protein